MNLDQLDALAARAIRTGTWNSRHWPSNEELALATAADPATVQALVAVVRAAQDLTNCVTPPPRYSPKWKAVDDALQPFKATA